MPKRSREIPEDYSDREKLLAREIGLRVRERRKFLNLTQNEVRTRMQNIGVYISKSQYSRIELGECLLNVAELIAIANVFGVTDQWILHG